MNTQTLLQGIAGVGGVEAVQQVMPTVSQHAADMVPSGNVPVTDVLKLVIQIVIAVASLFAMFKKKDSDGTKPPSLSN